MALYLAHDAEDAGVSSPLERHFFMAVVDAEYLGPRGPGIVVGTVRGRRWQDLERGDGLGILGVTVRNQLLHKG